MDAGDVLMAIILIGCAGWVIWITVTSNRRARESGNAAADAGGADGDPQLPGAPDPLRGAPPEVPTRTGARASAPSTGRTSLRAGRRMR